MKFLFSLMLIVFLPLVSKAEFTGPIYVLQGVDKDNVSDSSLRAADGFSIRVSWNAIDQGTSYNFKFLDSQIARARKLNKPWMLRLMTGENSPGWLKKKVPIYQDAPIPWNSTAQQALSSMIRRLGERYSGDPLLNTVHLSSTANSSSAEMHLAKGIQNVKGYSDQKIVDAWRSAIQAYSSAFPGQHLALNEAWEPKGSEDGRITWAVIADCKAILGGRATFQHNSLKADTSPTAKHHAVILELQKQGWPTGFQTACPAGNRDRFGGSFNEIFSIPGVSKAKYLEIYQGDL
jgi:hypothetical protein